MDNWREEEIRFLRSNFQWSVNYQEPDLRTRRNISTYTVFDKWYMFFDDDRADVFLITGISESERYSEGKIIKEAVLTRESDGSRHLLVIVSDMIKLNQLMREDPSSFLHDTRNMSLYKLQDVSNRNFEWSTE